MNHFSFQNFIVYCLGKQSVRGTNNPRLSEYQRANVRKANVEMTAMLRCLMGWPTTWIKTIQVISILPDPMMDKWYSAKKLCHVKLVLNDADESRIGFTVCTRPVDDFLPPVFTILFAKETRERYGMLDSFGPHAAKIEHLATAIYDILAPCKDSSIYPSLQRPSITNREDEDCLVDFSKLDRREAQLVVYQMVWGRVVGQAVRA